MTQTLCFKRAQTRAELDANSAEILAVMERGFRYVEGSEKRTLKSISLTFEKR